MLSVVSLAVEAATCDGLIDRRIDRSIADTSPSNASEIWWSERINGAWYHDYRVPGHQSWGGAALGCFGTRAIMVHNGLYGDL